MICHKITNQRQELLSCSEFLPSFKKNVSGRTEQHMEQKEEGGVVEETSGRQCVCVCV